MNHNGRPIPFHNPNIPIVGQPFDIHHQYPTVMFTCRCGEKGATPLVFIGLRGVVTCQGCGKQYSLIAITFKQDGSAESAIAQVGQAPRADDVAPPPPAPPADENPAGES